MATPRSLKILFFASRPLLSIGPEGPRSRFAGRANGSPGGAAARQS